jgi:hypothetical protein
MKLEDGTQISEWRRFLPFELKIYDFGDVVDPG